MERKLRTRIDSIDPKVLLIKLLPWLFLLLLFLASNSVEVGASPLNNPGE